MDANNSAHSNVKKKEKKQQMKNITCLILLMECHAVCLSDALVETVVLGASHVTTAAFVCMLPEVTVCRLPQREERRAACPSASCLKHCINFSFFLNTVETMPTIGVYLGV